MLVLAVACGGSAKPSPTPPTVPQATQPAGLQPAVPAPPADDARKSGFPTEEQCRNAVDRAVLFVKSDPDKAKEIIGDEGEFVAEGLEDCNNSWSLAKVDCVFASTTFADVDACMQADYELADPNFDTTTSIGHASVAECTAVVDHLATIGDDQEEGTREEVIARCQRSFRRHRIGCLMAATTKEAALDCRQRRR